MPGCSPPLPEGCGTRVVLSLPGWARPCSLLVGLAEESPEGPPANKKVGEGGIAHLVAPSPTRFGAPPGTGSGVFSREVSSGALNSKTSITGNCLSRESLPVPEQETQQTELD